MNEKMLRGMLERETPSALLSMIFQYDALPEVGRLIDVIENPVHHPEGKTGEHMVLVMNHVFELTKDPEIRLAALLHDVGKAVTGGKVSDGIERSLQPGKHAEHDTIGAKIIEKMFHDYRWSSYGMGLSMDVAKYHIRVHMIFDGNKVASSSALLNLIDHMITGWKERNVPKDSWRPTMEKLLISCQADAQGRLGRKNVPYPQRDIMMACFDKWLEFNTAEFIKKQSCRGEERSRLRQDILTEMTDKMRAANENVNIQEIQVATTTELEKRHPDTKLRNLHHEIKETATSVIEKYGVIDAPAAY